MNLTKGGVDAMVQGRAERAYQTRIVFDVYPEERWDQIVQAMSASAMYAAKFLAGELPPNIEDLFAPAGVKLLPADAGEVQVSCTCGDSEPWCKHVCCVGYLFASRLKTEPFLMFGIRGMEADEVRERLRERRAAAGAGTGGVSVYAQQVPGVSDQPPRPFGESLDEFWDAGPSLREIELPLGPPPVSHPLLRRLGPSPFQGATFPLVGLLASCYEVISEDAARETEQASDPDPATEDGDQPETDDELTPE